MTELCELALKYGTDKWGAHSYTPHYDSFFKDRRNAVKKVLEIGLGNPDCPPFPDKVYKPGSSHRMWEEYFPNAEIYGLDVEVKLLVNQGRIHSFYCDQANEASLRAAMLLIGKDFDLIVDDGSHVPLDQVLTAKLFVPLLAPNGVYVIEDTWIDPNNVCGGDTRGLVLTDIPYETQVIPCSEPAVQGCGDDRLVVIRN
jgi:hypothetical protein